MEKARKEQQNRYGKVVNGEQKTQEKGLSSEEVDAMYEKFCERLQKEGFADENGNPTEKTLEIRRKNAEEAKRKERAAAAKRRKHHWKSAAKAAGVVLVAGGCLFGVSMTSQANRIRLVNSVESVWNGGNGTGTNNGENREYSAGNIDAAKAEIVEKLHVEVPEFYYIPDGMTYRKTKVLEATQMAIMEYDYEDADIYFTIAANEKDLSQGDWKAEDQVDIEMLDTVINVKISILDDERKQYFATWKYKDGYYQLGGNIERKELLKILQEMQYNL